jgi:hypothetical protein
MKRMELFIIFALLICGLWMSPLRASHNFNEVKEDKSTQATKAEQEIRTIFKEWTEALVRNDSAVRGRIMADDFTLTAYDGQVINKAQILEAAKSSAYRIEAINPEDIKVRVYDDAAVLNGRVALTERINDKRVTSRIQVTQTWIKRQGQWQAVAEQATRIIGE